MPSMLLRWAAAAVCHTASAAGTGSSDQTQAAISLQTAVYSNLTAFVIGPSAVELAVGETVILLTPPVYPY